MAKFRKIDAFIARCEIRLDELEAQGVDITKLGDPVKQAETAARWAKTAAKRNARHAAAKADRVALAATFAVGQAVRTIRPDRGCVGPLFGTVAAIDGGVVTLDGGRAFTITALTAA